jgi:4-amino-4-deoxy-L-arabinose transferase-like glycosyltransferase
MDIKKIYHHKFFWLYILLGIAVIVRIDYLTWLKVSIFPDSASYFNAVYALVNDGRIINPGRTPVYPIFLMVNFILFGYMELGPVVIMQALSGIASVAFVYFIMLHLTKSRFAAFVAGLLLATDLHLIAYDSFILTESLTVFMVIVTIGAFLRAIAGKFNIKGSLFLSLSILILIFLRPVFIFLLALTPLTVLLFFLHEKKWKPSIHFFLLFFIIVIIPYFLWCFSVKKKFGFFGVSNVGNINVLGIILEDGYYKDASEEYKDIVALIDMKMDTLSPGDKMSPYYYIADIQNMRPHKGYADYSGVKKFCQSVIRNNPKRYIRRMFHKLPVAFHYAPIRSKYRGNGGLVSEWTERFYSRTIHTLFNNSFWLIFVCISLLLLLPWMHHDFLSWIDCFTIISIIWGVILITINFSHAEFQRLRTPVEPLIILTVCLFVYISFRAVRRFLRNRGRKKNRDSSLSKYQMSHHG